MPLQVGKLRMNLFSDLWSTIFMLNMMLWQLRADSQLTVIAGVIKVVAGATRRLIGDLSTHIIFISLLTLFLPKLLPLEQLTPGTSSPSLPYLEIIIEIKIVFLTTNQFHGTTNKFHSLEVRN